jgi:hypothetical protein
MSTMHPLIEILHFLSQVRQHFDLRRSDALLFPGAEIALQGNRAVLGGLGRVVAAMCA